MLNTVAYLALPTLLFGSFYLFGGLKLWMGLSRLNMARRSLNWDSAEGTIVKVVLKNANHKEARFADVVYRYHVRGERFEGHRIAFDYDRDEDPQLVEQLRTSQRIQVFYDPHDPASSTLVPGIQKTFNDDTTSGLFTIAATSYILLLFCLLRLPDQNLIDQIQVLN